MKHLIKIQTNPSNPVNYLACCGVFDLLARMDSSTLGWWQITPTTIFNLESNMSEGELMNIMLPTLCSLDSWNFFPTQKNPTSVEVTFKMPGENKIVVPLDWWLETAEMDGSIREKSAWKMYAGQQTISGIITDMVHRATCLNASNNSINTITKLLEQRIEMRGRFGFDPRASRNALDIGYSPNDLHMPVETYVFAEILDMFSVSSFFPARTKQAKLLSSTRSWSGREESDSESDGSKGFTFCLWTHPAPIMLARTKAVLLDAPDSVALFSIRATRKNYSNMTMAQTKKQKKS